jgi:hypothetical protein
MNKKSSLGKVTCNQPLLDRNGDLFYSVKEKWRINLEILNKKEVKSPSEDVFSQMCEIKKLIKNGTLYSYNRK